MLNKKMLIIALSLLSASAMAQTPPAGANNHPCENITAACTPNFVAGGYAKGNGIEWDCVCPLMQGKAQLPGATAALPTVPASTISACTAKHAKFGKNCNLANPPPRTKKKSS
jgi:hypothetical protein